MPLHGVGIIVGGTIAVIGSGYAFKKYVYDPHLAHYVEAFIAQHQLLQSQFSSTSATSTAPNARRRVPIPMLATTSATSSARQPNLTHVRRRRSTRDRAVEDIELESEMSRPLLWSGCREESAIHADELDNWGESRRATILISEADRTQQRHRSPVFSPDHDPSVSHSLVDLRQEVIEDVESAPSEGYEIRSIIFDRIESEEYTSPPPAVVGDMAAVPSRSEPVACGDVAVDEGSLTGSAYSSIPLRSSALSDSWTSGTMAGEPRAIGDDDVYSEIHRGADSYYFDAETYSPNSRPSSPLHAFPHASPSSSVLSDSASRLTAAAVALHEEAVAADTGLAYISLHVPAVFDAAHDGRVEVAHSRGPMSVVSLSESEEGQSDVEWEAI